MVGLLWTMQLLNYSLVGADAFPCYEAADNRRFAQITMWRPASHSKITISGAG